MKIKIKNNQQLNFRGIFIVLITISTLFVLVNIIPSISLKKRADDSHTIIASSRSNVLDSVIKRRSGGIDLEWNLVDWNNPITPEEEEKFQCKNVTFISASSGKSAPMCVHTFRDIVSNRIRDTTHWSDCDILPALWNASNPTKDSIYIEIGANIGACVMEMLLGTNANIIAFEPHPMNVFNLKKTVSNLDKSYQDRLRLFPIGMGDNQGSNTIYSGGKNMGNSVIGSIIKDWETQEFDEKFQFQINVERLDSIIKFDNTQDAKLMKMDAQGYECRILKGFGQDLANKIGMIKFEYATKWLEGKNCTDLVPQFINYGFNTFRTYVGGLEFKGHMQGNPSRHTIVDLFAVRNEVFEKK